ncbi:MAG: hypothetical protein OHK0017_09520 [Patescibacteria group bacterium]
MLEGIHYITDDSFYNPDRLQVVWEYLRVVCLTGLVVGYMLINKEPTQSQAMRSNEVGVFDERNKKVGVLMERLFKVGALSEINTRDALLTLSFATECEENDCVIYNYSLDVIDLKYAYLMDSLSEQIVSGIDSKIQLTLTSILGKEIQPDQVIDEVIETILLEDSQTRTELRIRIVKIDDTLCILHYVK